MNDGQHQSADRWPELVQAAGQSPRPLAGTISLVIPTLGRDILVECLAAVLAGTRWPASIIVADQGPSAAVARWLADLRPLGIDARHEPCMGRGKSLGLNMGLRLVRTSHVVIIDDDCIPEPEWIERFERHFRYDPLTVFTGRVAAGGHQPVLETVTSVRPVTARRPGLSFDRFSGGNFGMAVEVLRQVGLFDEDPCVRFAEDSEWAYRALRAGVPIAYAPDLVVTHVGWREFGERLDQYRGYARCHAAFFGKHLRRGDAFILLRAGVHLARALKRWLRGGLRRDSELAANGRIYAAQLIPGMIAGMKSKHRPATLE